MNNSAKRAVSASALILGATLCTAGPAMAQDSEESEARLREVTISAQRREESLQDVPIAVSAFSAEDLVIKQIAEPLDLLNYVPNLFGGNNTGLGTANSYYIRGLGNTESIATFDPPVGTYVDEIYIARQNANNIAFFDVERVEVLRGPQGTLFGRNTTGGAVSTTMKKPAEEFGGYIEAGIGSYDRFLVRGSVDVPLSEQVLTKFSAFTMEDDGYVNAPATGESLNGQEAYGFRADLRLLFNDKVTWDLSADITEDSGLNILNYDASASPLGSAVPGGETQDGDNRISNTGLSTSDGSGTLLEQALAGEGLGNDNSSYSITSNLAWDVTEEGTVNFIVGVRSLEQDFIIDFFDGGLGGEQYAQGGFTIANAGEHDQFSAELKYDASYLDGTLDLVTGLYYFSEDNVTDFADIFTINVSTDPSVIVPVPLLLADRTLENDLTSVAAYFQADWQLVEDWTVTVGARWTQEEKEIEYFDNTGSTSPDALTTANIQAAGLPTEQVTALVTPRIALQYDATDDVNFFVSYTEGFKSGGWNARGTSAPVIVPFDRELAKSYEAGIRSVLFDNRVRFNATAFFTDVEDLQTPSAFVAPDGSISFITQNFSDLENQGLEIDFDWSVSPGLDVYASLGLQDAEYKNPGQSILDQQAQCLIDGTGAQEGIVDPDCNIAEPVRVPDVTLTVGASRRFELPEVGAVFTPSINVRYVGETYTGTSNAPASFEDGYTLLNLGATIDWPEAGWSLVLECKNCTDEAYVVSNLSPTIYYNDPQRLEARIRKSF